MLWRNLLSVSTVTVLFLLLVVGAYVTAAGFGGLCGVNTPEDWPLCNGGLLPPPDFGSVVEYSHRILASLSGLFMVITSIVYWRDKTAPAVSRRMFLLALLSIFIEIGVGGVVVNTDLAASVVTVHQAIALLVFGLTVGATAVSLKS